MLRSYLAAYLRHNRSSSVVLAALSFVACAFLGLVMGVTQMILTDYFVRMEYLGETPGITGSAIAFGAVTAISSVSIVFMLKSAFDVAMHARIRQLGVFKSIGATDGQVRRLLLAEGCVLALPAGCLGVFAGMGLALVLVTGLVALTAENRVYDPVVELAPAAMLTALGVAIAVIALSALLPARRLGKISVVKAIAEGDASYDRVRKPSAMARLLGRACGIEARLAADSLRARRRSMRTANISIAFAVLAFVTLINFETLSHLSTQVTYFQRYEDVWDVRVTVDGAARDGVDEALVAELRALDGAVEVTTGDPYKAESGDAFYNVLADSQRSAERITSQLEERFASASGVEVLNLQQEAERDERSRAGLRAFVDVFAGVLAAIGIADVFASVLGRIPARRRELAQLQAAGISLGQIRRMFTVESVLIVARPLAWAMLLNVAIVVLAVQASPVSMDAFLTNMPLVHIGVFLLACWLPVLFAYRLGERVLLRGPAPAIAAD